MSAPFTLKVWIVAEVEYEPDAETGEIRLVPWTDTVDIMATCHRVLERVEEDPVGFLRHFEADWDRATFRVEVTP